MRTTVTETMEKMNEQGVVQYAIDWLRDNGFIPQEDLDIKSISEQEYDDALNKLKGNYMSISKEDEQTIINIAKRF